MSTDDPTPTPADESAGAPQDEGAVGDETARAGSSSEADAPPPAEEVGAEQTDENVMPSDEALVPEAGESADVSDEPARVAPSPPSEPEQAAAVGPTAGPADQSGGEEYEPEAPRQKPEIPGADLEVFMPQEEEQYLDAEAQAAAEAEAEAAAERARAEAEDEQARPIADAAIDLAAGARYTATGKRKTSVARVILKPGAGEYVINGRPLEAMFPRETLRRMIRQPLETVGYEARMDVVARMHGGGVSAQAGALRHGISRALIVADPNLRGELKRRGYLTRDPRVKERKKAGLKKARKRPQFSKR